MRKILFVAIVVVGIKCTLTIQVPTPNIHERLAILQKQLTEDIQEKQFSVVPITSSTKPKIKRRPITPVTRQKRKRRTRKTTKSYKDKNTTIHDSILHTINPSRARELSEVKKWQKYMKMLAQRDKLYRRGFMHGLSEVEIKKRHAMLCVDLLRPVLANMKKNATVTKIVGGQTANRLIEILSHSAAESKDEVESLLYQINILQLRFFQWEVHSIKKLLNFIMPGQRHSFKTMKHGLKRIFDAWHMDLSNTTLLIKESRMFRPPCIGTTEGSTRSSRGTRYTKPFKPKSTCAPKDKKCLVYASSSFED